MISGSKYFFRPKRPSYTAEEQAFLSKMPATFIGKFNGNLMFLLNNQEEYYLHDSQKDHWFILPYEEYTQEESKQDYMGVNLGKGIEGSNLEENSKYFIRFRKEVSTPEEHAIQSQMPATYLGKRGDVLGFQLQNGFIYEITERLNTLRDKDGNEMIIRPYAGSQEGKDYLPERRKKMIGDIMVAEGYGDAGLKIIDNDDDPEELRHKQRFVKRTNEEQLIQYLERHPLVYLWTPNPTISPFLRNRHFRYLGKRPGSPNIIVFQLADPVDDELDFVPPVECFYENGILRSTRTGTVVSFRIPVAEERETGKMGNEEEGSRQLRKRRRDEDEELSRAPISSRTRSSKNRRLNSSGGKSRRRKHKRQKCKRKSFRKNHY